MGASRAGVGWSHTVSFRGGFRGGVTAVQPIFCTLGTFVLLGTCAGQRAFVGKVSMDRCASLAPATSAPDSARWDREADTMHGVVRARGCTERNVKRKEPN
jgi:hypothetical protein